MSEGVRRGKGKRIRYTSIAGEDGGPQGRGRGICGQRKRAAKGRVQEADPVGRDVA